MQSKPFFNWRVRCVVLAWAFSLSVLAEDALYSMPLAELLQLKVTGSTLTEQSLDIVPSSVTVFTHEQIERMGLDSLDELMNLVPGYQSYRSSSSSVVSSFSSRGRRVGSVGSEILVLIDGQRMEDMRTGGSFVVLPKFPLTSIARVEFIRGLGSAIYGSNAMMGVVNIITRQDSNELSLAYGDLNRIKASLAVSQELGRLFDDSGGNNT